MCNQLNWSIRVISTHSVMETDIKTCSPVLKPRILLGSLIREGNGTGGRKLVQYLREDPPNGAPGLTADR